VTRIRKLKCYRRERRISRYIQVAGNIKVTTNYYRERDRLEEHVLNKDIKKFDVYFKGLIIQSAWKQLFLKNPLSDIL
jgi:hypothetical protein